MSESIMKRVERIEDESIGVIVDNELFVQIPIGDFSFLCVLAEELELEENNRLREALEFYANEAVYGPKPFFLNTYIDEDRGVIARAALEDKS